MSKAVWIVLLGLVAVGVMCGKSFAGGSGAYRVEVPDAAALSLGGAVVGQADTPVAVFYNPAGMTQIKSPEVSTNLSMIRPIGVAQPSVREKTKMQQENFFIPGLFFVTPVAEKMSLGIGVTSNWGLSTDWAQDSFARYVSTRSSLKNEDYILSGAYQLTEKFSLGLGVTVDASSIEKEKKITQAGIIPDANFKLQGDNTAAGFQVSGLYKVSDRHQFGVQYSSDIRRKYHGKVHLDGFNNAVLTGVYKFDPNFTGSSYETDVVSKATLPQSVDIGYCYRPTDKLTLNADILWMDWASIKKEELAYPNETNASRLAFLNLGNPANRDWKSAVSLGLGAEYKLVERLRLRGGYYFHQSPIPQDTWEPTIPDADSHSIAAGFGYDITKAMTLDFTYSAMFYDTRTINNQVGDAVGPIDGKYQQWTNILAATVTYRF